MIERPYKNGQKLSVIPPLAGKRIIWPNKGRSGDIPTVRVIFDDGERIVVKSATPGLVFKKIVCLVPAIDSTRTITPIEERPPS